MEALIWAERARARTLRYALINAGGYEDEFEEDDKVAEYKIMAALSSCKGSVVAVEYSFVQTNLLIWVLKPGMPPTVHQVLVVDDSEVCQITKELEVNRLMCTGKCESALRSAKFEDDSGFNEGIFWSFTMFEMCIFFSNPTHNEKRRSVSGYGV